MKEIETLKKVKLSKQTINIIRTTLRNNIELTHIADNKANVLLSLNGIMLTFLIPLVLSNYELVIERRLYLPLILFVLACSITMFIAATVLKPSRFEKFRDVKDPNAPFSPFFFGNFYKMDPEDFFNYMNQSLAENGLVKRHLAQDLYYVGQRLGYKMNLMRYAFNIFLAGIFLSLISSGVLLFIW